jgi:hypothetical protein
MWWLALTVLGSPPCRLPPPLTCTTHRRPTDHQTAYSEYAGMRDALNATGRPFFFSLCGWEGWYGAVGASLGHSARIGNDDTNWYGVLSDIDSMAPLWPYAGPYYGNDPCLLLGADNAGVQAVTEQQSRAQFSMWAVLRAPMLLSQSVVNMSAHRLETYTNTEVIAVGQDAMGRQGMRLKGGDVSARARGLQGHRPKRDRRRAPELGGAAPATDVAVTMQPCAAGAGGQVWKWNVSGAGFLSNPASGACLNQNDCGSQLIAFDCVTTGGTCAGPTSYANEQFALGADGKLTSPLAPGACATRGGGDGAGVSMQPCGGAGTPGQGWTYDATTSMLHAADAPGLCLTVGDGANGANVWGRPLAGGPWALVYLNTGLDDLPSLACDYAGCLAATGWAPDQVVSVRDLWAHAELGNFTAGAGWNSTDLPAAGGVAMYKLTPVWAHAT